MKPIMKAEGVFLRSGLKVTCAPNFCSLLCQLYFHLGLEEGEGLLLTWLFVMGLPAPHFFSADEAPESSFLRFVFCFCFLIFLCFLCVFCDRTGSILSPRFTGDIHWPGQVSFLLIWASHHFFCPMTYFGGQSIPSLSHLDCHYFLVLPCSQILACSCCHRLFPLASLLVSNTWEASRTHYAYSGHAFLIIHECHFYKCN